MQLTFSPYQLFALVECIHFLAAEGMVESIPAATAAAAIVLVVPPAAVGVVDTLHCSAAAAAVNTLYCSAAAAAAAAADTLQCAAAADTLQCSADTLDWPGYQSAYCVCVLT